MNLLSWQHKLNIQMSVQEEITIENPLSSSELFELITSDSLSEISNRLNTDPLITPDYLEELLSTENKYNQIPIYLAIILGRLEIFKLLLSKTTKTNETNRFGNALHCWNRFQYPYQVIPLSISPFPGDDWRS